MNVQTIEAPAVEPVSLQDVYRQLRLTPDQDGTHPDDPLLTSQISTARQYAEQFTKRAFVRQKLRASFDRFPFGCGYSGTWLREERFDHRTWREFLELPRPPLLEVTQVAYLDFANAQQVVDPASYFVSSDASSVPRLQFVVGFIAPFHAHRGDALSVEYYAGYPPTDPANVPEAVKQALLLDVQLHYDSLAPDDRDRLERARDSLLSTVRVHSL